MDSPTTTTTIERVDPLFSPSEQLALAGFLAGYSGLTRDAYALDLRQFVTWCTEHHLALFAVRRASPSLPGPPAPSTSRWANGSRGRSSWPPPASGSTATAQPASCGGWRAWLGSPSE